MCRVCFEVQKLFWLEFYITVVNVYFTLISITSHVAQRHLGTLVLIDKLDEMVFLHYMLPASLNLTFVIFHQANVVDSTWYLVLFWYHFSWGSCSDPASGSLEVSLDKTPKSRRRAMIYVQLSNNNIPKGIFKYVVIIISLFCSRQFHVTLLYRPATLFAVEAEYLLIKVSRVEPVPCSGEFKHSWSPVNEA